MPIKCGPTTPIYLGIEGHITEDQDKFTGYFCVVVHDGYYALDTFDLNFPITFVKESFGTKAKFTVAERQNCLQGVFCQLIQIEDPPTIQIDSHDKFLKANELLFHVIIDWINAFTRSNGVKVIAAGVSSNTGRLKDQIASFASNLWLHLDILPCIFKTKGSTADERADSAVRKAILFFGADHLPRVDIGYHNRVLVDRECMPILTLKDYLTQVPSNVKDFLMQLASSLKKKHSRIAFFSSTPQGGGVALMRHSLLRIMNLLGIRANWYVMRPVQSVFQITKKKFHNVLQGIAPGDTEFTDQDMAAFLHWSEMNAVRFWQDEVFIDADIIVLDDPQVCGLMPFIKQVNKRAKILFRSHIQLSSELVLQENTVYHKVWNFVWDKIKECDLFISHPIPGFVPDCVPKDKVVYVPASTDPLDGLNKRLDDNSVCYYLRLFERVCAESGAKPTDLNLPYIIQISRFDPSKGIKDLMDAYLLMREHIEIRVQLLICGHASVDDPEGNFIYNQMLLYLSEPKFDSVRDEVCIVRLPPSDQLLNVLLSNARVATQLSIREGFEIKVTESILKGVPVVACKTGGIPIQLRDSFNGFLVEPSNIQEIAGKLKLLLTNEDLYLRLKENCSKSSPSEFTTPFHAASWLCLFDKLIQGEHIPPETHVRNLWSTI